MLMSAAHHLVALSQAHIPVFQRNAHRRALNSKNPLNKKGPHAAAYVGRYTAEMLVIIVLASCFLFPEDQQPPDGASVACRGT